MKNKIILLFFNFLFFNNISYSCDCNIQKMSVGKIIRSDFVFKGKIIEKQILYDTIELKYPSRNKINLLPKIKYTFKVKEQIKGSYKKNKIEIISPGSGGMCGVYYSIGDEYYIYASHVNPRISEAYNSTNNCLQNLKVSKANKKYKEIIREYKRSRKTRVWKDIDNVLFAKGKISKENPIGEWTFYHKDGSIKSNGKYSNGKKEGIWNYYYPKEFSLKIKDSIDKEILDKSSNKNNLLCRFEIYDQGRKVKDVKLIERN